MGMTESGKPVEGVRLSHWQRPGIEGTSDADGLIRIRDVPPGKYRVRAEKTGFVASDAATRTEGLPATVATDSMVKAIVF